MQGKTYEYLYCDTLLGSAILTGLFSSAKCRMVVNFSGVKNIIKSETPPQFPASECIEERKPPVDIEYKASKKLFVSAQCRAPHQWRVLSFEVPPFKGKEIRVDDLNIH
jgi:hypothetical protein